MRIGQRRGGERPSTVLARVLKRPEYKQAGDRRIVDPRVWNAAQDSLARRRKRAA